MRVVERLTGHAIILGMISEVNKLYWKILTIETMRSSPVSMVVYRVRNNTRLGRKYYDKATSRSRDYEEFPTKEMTGQQGRLKEQKS
jgi:hypothetical protein